MRVLINALFWAPTSGGAGRYAHELLPALLATDPRVRLRVLVPRDLPASVLAQPWAPSVEWLRLKLPAAGGGPPVRAARLAAQWGFLALEAGRWRADVVHGLANVAPPAVPGAARVVTLLDLIWLRHRGSMGRLDRLAMHATAVPSLRRATRVLAISEAVRRDAIATLGLPAARVDVAPLGVRLPHGVAVAPEQELRAGLELGDRRVLLCVAQKRRHKNLDGLLRAFAMLDVADAVLVIPGVPTPYENELRALADELDIRHRLRLPPWLPDRQLEGLYRLATAFVLPSLEEGFGLPVLEAMSRGLPVACADAPALREIAGDAAERFEPTEPAAIAAALARLFGDPARRSELARKGAARVAAFTWDRTAQATLDCYERAAASR